MPRSRKASISFEPHLAGIGGVKLEVGGDERAQKVAERDVDGRHVVEGPKAHPEEPVRQLRRLGGKAINEVRMEARRPAVRRSRLSQCARGPRCGSGTP